MTGGWQNRGYEWISMEGKKMEQERWKRLEKIYHDALECPLEARPDFVIDACGDDDALRREVEALLKYDDPSGNFIQKPASEVVAKAFAEAQATLPLPLQIGQQISIYRLLELLGRGGMGKFISRWIPG